MNTRRYFQSVVLVLCASFIGPVAAKQKQGHSADLDIAKIEQMTGLKGTLDKNEKVQDQPAGIQSQCDRGRCQDHWPPTP